MILKPTIIIRPTQRPVHMASKALYRISIIQDPTKPQITCLGDGIKLASFKLNKAYYLGCHLRVTL